MTRPINRKYQSPHASATPKPDEYELIFGPDFAVGLESALTVIIALLLAISACFEIYTHIMGL